MHRIVIFLFVVGFAIIAFAQSDMSAASVLKKQIAESSRFDEAVQKLQALIVLYTNNNSYDELYGYLRSLEKKNIFRKSPFIYYHKALTRFNQIQFLEESKKWEELFNNKEAYYVEIGQALEKVRKMSGEDYEVALKAKLLEYRVAKKKDKDLFDVSQALLHLAQQFATKQAYRPALVKDIANELLREGETNYAKKLYALYVSTIAQSDINHEEIKKMAWDFFKEGNVDLAVSLFAAYVDKLVDTHQGKDFIMSETLEIIEAFAHSGWHEGKDPFFAEDLFAKIEKVYTSDAFGSLTQYKRAYNLEKMKEYEACVKEYLKLVNEFGDYQEKDRIYFRLGIVSAYALDTREQARTFFSKVVNDFKESQDYCNSAYHLGLLYQGEGKNENALSYYRLILEKMKDAIAGSEIVRLAKDRIRELEENEDMEYNLRLFLNAVLSPQTKIPSLQLELFAKNAKEYLGNPVTFQVNTYLSDTGCLQQSYTYLWSGQLGSTLHPFNEEKLETSYQETGTKVVNVALVDPMGVVNGTFEIVDVYPPLPQSVPIVASGCAGCRQK